MVSDVMIVPITPDDWDEYRTLRLEMLGDTPIAYLETREHALGLNDEAWKFRAWRANGPTTLGLAGVDASGNTPVWVGTMSAYLSSPGVAHLVSVYLNAGYRGSDVADRMLDRVVEWAQDRPDVAVLKLLVHEDNARAIAFYERQGFTRTGHSEPYPLNLERSEIEMSMNV
ncbi:hypothetical protein GCM10022198_13800 [Klugiella xanthotipulae]|uniref:Ribosomal protein S18 acetylase RimI-like enzyme n=1 Tax=Klugiella xanthotipulae TaxID=244735 RepID=A0A543I4H1_9MICO|nr:N-acetyltransferase [Klugiella xanthotipulae]TQM65467.1 ribosomal protein S18 acetylase RimI-like enzyme [Klugiella xanthotipulae]